MKKYYFSIELKDFRGYVYIVDKPFCNDEVQFRKMVFGIMAACYQFDLLKLGSDTPIYKDVLLVWKLVWVFPLEKIMKL